MDADVLVVGAGPAGLAVTACLKRHGVEPLVVDRGMAVGDSWRNRYARLHLHTPRVQSALPGMRIPRSFGRWVSKDDMAEYLRQYAEHHGITPRFGTEVQRLERSDGAWTALTSDGKLTARQVVVASGYNCSPVVPSWPGQESFPGEVLHASRYSRPEPYRDRAVLVVGPGNTGAEIAATGYTTGLLPVAGHLGVLDERGRPLVHGHRTAPSAPGLRFVGLTSPLKGLLLQISLDARAVARAVARELRTST